jgi:asparagine synthase (glutamine-hydrolysing)
MKIQTNAASEILHWDGRLDNREDLLLQLSDSLAGDSSDAALALGVYRRWGSEGLVHLIGDWSFVIRDGANGAIVLASDYAGVRPLYYCERADCVHWSSNLQLLVDATGSSDLDETYVAGLLSFGGCPNRTPYKGIHSVPAGHSVHISAKEKIVRPFWTMAAGDTIHYASDRQYEDHLRSLFREAVAVRLPKNSTALAELSGGLDSSSVVAMAHRLIRSGEAGGARLATVSYVWPNSLDTPFIREMESCCGTEGIHISTEQNPLLDQAHMRGAAPEPLGALRESVVAAAAKLNARTFLTGLNGDLAMGNWFNDSLQIASQLRSLEIGGAWNDALAWSKKLRVPVYTILWRGLQAALPAAIAPANVYAIADGSYSPRNQETSLASDFAGRTMPQPRELFSDDWKQARPDRRKHFRDLTMMCELRTLQRPAAFENIDYTHPFAHRPLVEFLMAVPARVLCGPGEPRRLMRRAFSGLWPQKLRDRRSKGLFGTPWQECLRPLALDLLQARRWQVVERGFVDRASFHARLTRLSAGLECNRSQLKNIILLELWLRQREQASSGEASLCAAA